MKESAQATLAIALIIALCSAGVAAYATYQLGNLEARVEELEGMLVVAMVTIDNGAENRTESVHLTKGATALDALERIAAVETRYYAGIGYYIVSIDGLSEDPGANKYWMWYIWNNDQAAWELVPVGAGGYKLKDGDSIKFSYEVVVW